MATKQDIQKTLNSMILSASGWRGIFAADEESKSPQISETHKIILGAAAHVFSEYAGAAGRPHIFLGTDTRPTGKASVEAIMSVLLGSNCDVCYAGVCAAPEIMAWARAEREASVEFAGSAEAAFPIGFIYVSASHNPIGYNGIKFGLADGGVLEPNEAKKVTDSFFEFINNDDNIKKIEDLLASIDNNQIENIYAVSEVSKINALKSYYEFCASTAFGDVSGDDPLFINSVNSVLNKPLGIVCDFNGSARTVSIDRDFFESLGLKFESINNVPGEIAHRIVPEGESLEPCREFLEEMHRKDPSFLIGYSPDCDGDRGNLVIWSESEKKARALEAQEVFALACVAEFAFQVWSKETAPPENDTKKKYAIAVNDPTSMRVDKIAESFGIEVFRAEVGEANVVGLASRLREQGYTVRILGEGAAGGNITHPSRVRDPLHTVMALVKLLVIKDERTNLYKTWCEKSGQINKYKDNFTFDDIIESLPKFVTTGVYENDAILKVNTQDHALLKDRCQKIFEREWEKRKDEFKTRLGLCKWEAIAYNGMEEKRRIARFSEAGKGGLKILFFNNDNNPAAFIWMRGSATEPVFRIMADIEGTDKDAERLLLNWLQSMIIEADTN